jgi:hypothetical protein
MEVLMKKVFRRTPSASMIVAILALVVAASGTAVAASALVNGDKLIKKHSLSGNRLRNHTITGTQVNLKQLGKVPSAANADHATLADTATTATNATNLGGQPAASYLTTASRIGTNGLAKASGTATGNTVTLFTVGPFTVKMTCTKTASGTTVSLSGTSTEASSDINGNLVATAGTAQDLGSTTDVNTPTSGFAQRDNVNIDFEAPSGAQAVLAGADGVNSFGTDCWANWAGIH